MDSETQSADRRYRFDRRELAGGLGDMGTLLPIALGMIVFNGLNSSGVFFSIGGFYLLSGLYYGVTVPVQPMKVIGAYALASGLGASQITAAGLLMGGFMLILGLAGVIGFIGKYTPKPVIRGVQMSTGTLLMAQGVKLILGESKIQAMYDMAEPFLSIQNIGPVPICMVLGIAGACMCFVLLENRKLPAGLAVILAGLAVGLIAGNHESFAGIFSFGIHLPPFLPFGLPTGSDISFALLVLVMPQIPMTLGNAVIANADLSKEYFGKNSEKVTYKGLCVSMGLANLFASAFGGMPLCHGAGGLAAHYRFGARTAGSNIMVGVMLILLAILLGESAASVLRLIPMSVLGVLLVFAGSQLAMTIKDMRERKDLFVVLAMLGITLASNLAAGFITGIALAYALKSDRFNV